MPLRLKKQGYTWCELSEVNTEFYNWLQPLKCNKSENLKKFMSELRIDMHNKQISNNQIKEAFEDYDKAYKRKNQIINDYKNITDFYQIWYYTDLNRLFRQLNLEINDYKKHIANIVSHFFNMDKNKEYIDISFCTYYDIGCHLQNHSDGTGTGRICALLIYLNEEYDENNGGILVLDNKEKIIPTFGKIAIIDLQSFDIQHMVTEVVDGIGRYALLSFIKEKENEFVDR